MIVHEKITALSYRFFRKVLLNCIKVSSLSLYQLHILSLFLWVPNSSWVISISLPPRCQQSLCLRSEFPLPSSRSNRIIFVLAAMLMPAFLFIFTLVVIRLVLLTFSLRLCIGWSTVMPCLLAAWVLFNCGLHWFNRWLYGFTFATKLVLLFFENIVLFV